MITLGHDVEFILETKTGYPVSVIGLIGGTKRLPKKVDLGALQEDNVLAEINILPATSVNEWETNTLTVISQLEKLLPADLVLSNKASAIYDEMELSNPLANTFGCERDYNAWQTKINPAPVLPPDKKNLRTAGGHVHIGYKRKLSIGEKFKLIKLLDSLVGIQSILIDQDTTRKLLYGKAGACRLKPYGVEWRTPSNFWVFSKELREWMYNACVFCATNLNDSTLDRYLTEDIEYIINTNSLDAAKVKYKLLPADIKIGV